MIRSNPASPRAPLGFLQRQGRFRDGVHASLHGALVMQLAGPSGPRPSSPLSPGDVARIAGIHRPGNLELARRYGCFAADDLRWFDGAQRRGPPDPEDSRAEDDALIAGLIEGLVAPAYPQGDLSGENARLRLALERRWGRMARMLFVLDDAHDWTRRRLRARVWRLASLAGTRILQPG